MAKMQILFDGFKDLADAVDRSGADLKEAVDDALTKTGDYISSATSSAASRYAKKGGGMKGYATGAMFKTIIKKDHVKWIGDTAEIGTGFKISQKGGWHSIFVMYGTPRMSKDTKIYNAIKGRKTKKEIAEIQQKAMQEHIKLGD